MVNEQLIDNVDLKANYSAKKDILEGRLGKGIEEELLNRTGLKEVSYAPEKMYTVNLSGLEGGKLNGKKYSGKSSSGIEDAVNNALKEGIVDYDPLIDASLEMTAKAPYFLVPVVSRSLDQANLENYQSSAIGQLADTYARRLNRKPDSA